MGKTTKKATKAKAAATKASGRASTKAPARAEAIVKGEGRIEIRPGHIIINTTYATGGVEYHRRDLSQHSINGGVGLEKFHETRKVVDNVEAVALVDAVDKRSDYLCRLYCANTAFGWYCDSEKLKELLSAFADLRVEAEEANRKAAAAGSERRVTVGVVVGTLEIGTADAAREIARTIREVLTDVSTAIRAGAVSGAGKENKLRAPLLRCKNLDRLAVGLAGEAIKAALHNIEAAKEEVMERTKKGEAPESAGRAVDLGAIENAISWFEEGGIEGYMDAKDNPVERALAAG